MFLASTASSAPPRATNPRGGDGSDGGAQKGEVRGEMGEGWQRTKVLKVKEEEQEWVGRRLAAKEGGESEGRGAGGGSEIWWLKGRGRSRRGVEERW